MGALCRGPSLRRPCRSFFDRLRPPTLGRATWTHLDYRISALPLGGYVRMAGDNPSEERTGDPDEFLSKPRWQRVLIALAGPTTNLLLAIILTAGIFVRGGQQPVYSDKPVVIAGVVKDSPAQAAGFQAGDRIVSFAGIQNPDWDRIELELLRSPRQGTWKRSPSTAAARPS